MADLRCKLLARAHTSVKLPQLQRHYGDCVIQPLPARAEGILTFRRDYSGPSEGEGAGAGADAVASRALDIIPRDLLARLDVGVDAAALLASLRDGTPATAAAAIDDHEDGGAAATPTDVDVPATVEDIWQTERGHDVEARVLHLSTPDVPRRFDMQLQLASLMPIVTGAEVVAQYLDRHVRYERDAAGFPRLRLGAPIFEVPAVAAAASTEAVVAATDTGNTAAPSDQFHVRAPPGRYSARSHTLNIVEECVGRPAQPSPHAFSNPPSTLSQPPWMSRVLDAGRGAQVPSLAADVGAARPRGPDRVALWCPRPRRVRARCRRVPARLPTGATRQRAGTLRSRANRFSTWPVRLFVPPTNHASWCTTCPRTTTARASSRTGRSSPPPTAGSLT